MSESNTNNEFYNNLTNIVNVGKDLSKKYYTISHTTPITKTITYDEFIINLEQLILNVVSKNIIDKRYKGVILDIGESTLHCLIENETTKNIDQITIEDLAHIFRKFIRDIEGKTGMTIHCKNLASVGAALVIDWALTVT